MATVPRLSLIIPAYNEAEYLPRLLDSRRRRYVRPVVII